MLSHDIVVSHEKQCALVMEYLAVLLPMRTPGLDFQYVAIAHREYPKHLQPLLDKDGRIVPVLLPSCVIAQKHFARPIIQPGII